MGKDFLAEFKQIDESYKPVEKIDNMEFLKFQHKFIKAHDELKKSLEAPGDGSLVNDDQ